MIEVRDVRIEDAEEILAILNPIIAARRYTAMDTPFTVEVEREFIRTFPARGIFLVAIDAASGRIVGFQNVSPFGSFTSAFDHVGVVGTYVDLERRRQGIAGRLFTATYDAARKKGYEKFFTYVRADNDAGLQTYLRQGFRIVGTAEGHARIDGQYIDEIVIERLLPATDDCRPTTGD
jgi:L-amino acid N-acyltransferase YncA